MTDFMCTWSALYQPSYVPYPGTLIYLIDYNKQKKNVLRTSEKCERFKMVKEENS